MTITSIDFWNYSKDPERGVKDIHIYVDSLLVYQVYNALHVKRLGLTQLSQDDDNMFQ